MVPSIVHTSISILSRFGSQFYRYHFLYCKRVGRQSIRHPLNSDIWIGKENMYLPNYKEWKSKKILNLILQLVLKKGTILHLASTIIMLKCIFAKQNCINLHDNIERKNKSVLRKEFYVKSVWSWKLSKSALLCLFWTLFCKNVRKMDINQIVMFDLLPQNRQCP